MVYRTRAVAQKILNASKIKFSIYDGKFMGCWITAYQENVINSYSWHVTFNDIVQLLFRINTNIGTFQ